MPGYPAIPPLLKPFKVGLPIFCALEEIDGKMGDLVKVIKSGVEGYSDPGLTSPRGIPYLGAYCMPGTSHSLQHPIWWMEPRILTHRAAHLSHGE